MSVILSPTVLWIYWNDLGNSDNPTLTKEEFWKTKLRMYTSLAETVHVFLIEMSKNMLWWQIIISFHICILVVSFCQPISASGYAFHDYWTLWSSDNKLALDSGTATVVYRWSGEWDLRDRSSWGWCLSDYISTWQIGLENTIEAQRYTRLD